MMRRAALALTLSLLATPAIAEIVRYTDDRGTNHYVEGMESVPQQYRARAVPLGMNNDGKAAPPAGGMMSLTPTGGATVQYAPGQRIMVNATINGSTPAQLLLDTGADRTMINPRVLAAAGVSLARPVGSAVVSGVAGSQQMQFVTINSLEVAGATVGKLTVAAHGIDGAGDGLLGRDFLEHFSVNIDSAKGVVTLTPK
ncbi:MAG TPA: retropepsin-like aspartic protease [Methylomirabilota bacterium]|nr:retropepsin-like aspartic protease [Methylomirabilota bacterium]